MSVTAYALVSQVRYRELKTRIALAAVIGTTAWFVAPGVWPIIWFAAVMVSQAVDWAVFRRYRQRPEWMPDRPYLILSCVTTAVGVAIYSSIAAWLWIAGGEVGRVFAMVQVAGGLLHVSLHMHQARPILISAVAPHGAYFLSLPMVTAIVTLTHDPTKRKSLEIGRAKGRATCVLAKTTKVASESATMASCRRDGRCW